MSAIGRVVRSGVGRRRVAPLVMCLTTMMAVTAAIGAGALLVVSQAPFDHAFAQQNGAHLMVQFDGAKSTSAQVAATAHAAGVTAASGPFPEVAADQVEADQAFGVTDVRLGAMTIVGRASPGGPVDDVTLTDGTWATRPGQIVLASDNGDSSMLGTDLRLPDAPGAPALTVVGLARSVSQTADAWVVPSQIPALRTGGGAPVYDMLYRFAAASSDAQLASDRTAVAAMVPHGAVTGSQSYLTVKTSADRHIAPFVPFIMAFGVLSLIMSVLIVSTVVSGAVGAGIRHIGVLKSLGFTPGQVVRAYIMQALVPTALGAGLGVLFGNLLAVALLQAAEKSYGTASLSVAAWVDVAVPLGTIAVVVIAAFIPALRAGRLSAIEAIVVGRTPRAERGRLARRLAGRLPLPRAVSLGLSGPFARPVRALAVGGAIVFGATAVTFAVGLVTSLNMVKSELHQPESAAVTVDLRGGPGPGPGIIGTAIPGTGPGATTTPDPAAVAAVIRAQPGTGSFYGTGRSQGSVSGITGSVNVSVFQGDASSAYAMVTGTWFTGPGQAVVPTEFFRLTGTRLGDTVTVVDDGRSVPLRIVGEDFGTENDGKTILTDVSTFGAAAANTMIDEYDIAVKPRTDVGAYSNALSNALQSTGAGVGTSGGGKSAELTAMDAMIVLLTLMLVAVAALGVLNSVVLDTRERVHDLGVYKAIGMTPRQTIGMVVASVTGVGLIAGVIGVPLGIALHGYILPVMGHAAGTDLPHTVMAVYHGGELVLLALGGAVIAVLGALLPASWAAKTGTATALRTE